MNKIKTPYSIFQKAIAVFLILTLVWLTGSTPFVMAAQQDLAKQQKGISIDIPVNDDCPDDGGTDTDSDGNNIEEKAPGGINIAEEFLHEHAAENYLTSASSASYPIENSDTYIAFHGDLHAPPPNVA
jgi:hypothetical protein